jgi:hypothetical protein
MNQRKSTRAAVGDLLYVQMETALKQESCPLCWHMSRVGKKFYKFLLREGMNSDNIYQSLMQSKGLCPPHAQDLMQAESPQGGKLGNAVLYQRLLERLMAGLTSYAPPSVQKEGLLKRKNRQNPSLYRLVEDLTPQEPCLACVHFRQYEGSVVAGLSRIMADPEEEKFKVLFKQSYMFCLPHFRMLLKASNSNTEAVEFILRCQQQKIQKLFNSLQVYIKNCQGKYDEAKAALLAQDDAWKQALEFFYGNF